jgi:hypothetical protein
VDFFRGTAVIENGIWDFVGVIEKTGGRDEEGKNTKQ